MFSRTHVILDGFQDPTAAQALSQAWQQKGYSNAVDLSGQSAWLQASQDLDQAVGPPGGFPSPPGPLSEAQMEHAAAIARSFGLELRDRVGSTYHPQNNLNELRRHVAYEYKSRMATILVFGLPAIALHYAGATLAGGSTAPRSLVYPWLFEMLLVGWGCLAGGWPILWQAALALSRLRLNADVLTSLLVAAAFVPSALGVLSLAVADPPWFIASSNRSVIDGNSLENPSAKSLKKNASEAQTSGAPGEASRGKPRFHAAWFVMTLALAQRWLGHRYAYRLTGRADVMIPSYHRIVAVWLVLVVAAFFLRGWSWSLAVGLVLPPMLGLGSINPWSPGVSGLLPVGSFLVFLWLSPAWLGPVADKVAIEAAAGFGLIMTVFFAAGWRAWPQPQADASPVT